MYRPTNVPSDPKEIPQYLDTELRKLSESLLTPDFVFQIATSYKEPAKIGDGMIVLADGAMWNPGAGAGYYGYYAGSWKKLG